MQCSQNLKICTMFCFFRQPLLLQRSAVRATQRASLEGKASCNGHQNSWGVLFCIQDSARLTQVIFEDQSMLLVCSLPERKVKTTELYTMFSDFMFSKFYYSYRVVLLSFLSNHNETPVGNYLSQIQPRTRWLKLQCFQFRYLTFSVQLFCKQYFVS